jgi:hypothetical protein
VNSNGVCEILEYVGWLGIFESENPVVAGQAENENDCVEAVGLPGMNIFVFFAV